MDVMSGMSQIFFYLWVAGLALGLFVFVDAAMRPAAAFVAAGKLTKPGWLAITGIATVIVLVFGLVSLLGIPALVAMLVYLVDVRPAVRAVAGGRPPSTSSW